MKLVITAGFICAALVSAAHAEGYLGLRATYSIQKPNRLGDRVAPMYTVDDRLRAPGVYAAYSFGPWSVEAGAGPLGRRTSHNVDSTFDIHQTIETKHVYGAVLYHWHIGQLSPHLLVGLSHVSMKNYEYGFNETGPAVQLNYSRTTAPMLGGGAVYAFGKAELRADVFRIHNIARSIWTNSSDVTAASLGIQYRF